MILNCIPNERLIDDIVTVGKNVAKADNSLMISNPCKDFVVFATKTIERLSDNFKFALHRSLNHLVRQIRVLIKIVSILFD